MEKLHKIEKMYWTKEEILQMVEDAPDIDYVGEHIKNTLNLKSKSSDEVKCKGPGNADSNHVEHVGASSDDSLNLNCTKVEE